jgi:SecD/SecF fusion protein
LAFVTIGTMIFDISIPAGAYWLWMSINSTIQIDTIFIIAILTTMWYSINDTIVIFDRIRENLQHKGTGKDISHGKVFEDSLWQTMRRSIGTSVSTLLVVIAMFLFGSGVIQGFAFAIGIWVIAWSYSSIFIAAPLAYIVSGKIRKNNKNH